MDFITSKAMIIAVGIFVTVIITSSVFIILGYVLDIYGNVSKIDYAYIMQVGEYDRYNNVILSGTEVLNMCNKFKNDKKVTINNKPNFGVKGSYNDSALRVKYKLTTIIDDETGNVIINIGNTGP